MPSRDSSKSCNTCRRRRVKCDGVKPVCGRCHKSNRQCEGFDKAPRLILKDETQIVIQKFKPKKVPSDQLPAPCLEAPFSSESPDSVEDNPTRSDSSNTDPSIDGADADNLEWVSLTRRLSPVYEQNQVALYCCRETVNIRTMSWIMADEKWIEWLPEMMARSAALSSIIYANAATYLAKTHGSPTTPLQALTHYAYALRALQLDLYDPIRQSSDETLFAIILLGVFDLHNSKNLASWQAHVMGATKLLQCKGSDYYKEYTSPRRVLAKYVRGFDIIRATSNQEETMFGDPEWDHLSKGFLVRPLDTLLTHYGRITNIIARADKLTNPTIESMTKVVTELTMAKRDLEAWRKELPAYYESILIPVPNPQIFDHPDILDGYPYTERLDYVTGFIGHTMCLYRAAILAIDRHLFSHVFPAAPPSESEITLGKEIVMSMPSLSTAGGIFLLYPAMRAAKVLARDERAYIMTVLQKVAPEVPVASSLADHLFEMEVLEADPSQWLCKPSGNVIFGDKWDTIQKSWKNVMMGDS